MILVVDVCHRDLSRLEFVKPIVSIVGGGPAVVDHRDLRPGQVDEAEAVVICGTALMDDGYLEHRDRFGWLGTTRTPVLGICAGMQLVALAHGARLVPSREIGMSTVEVLRPDDLLEGERLEAYQLHRHGLEDLGEFNVLARTEACAQAIRHRELPQWGIMFHPEVRNAGVVRRFLRLAKKG